jgi:NTP pyrophosphatase (non-canonical NTP hydrolase)
LALEIWDRSYLDVETDGQFLDFLQEKAQLWREHSFPPEHRTAVLQALGVSEESGELAHATLKREQGIRGTDEEHAAAERDAVGDIVIYLAGFCSSRGYSLQQCVEDAWQGVCKRDWSKYKEDGKNA